MFSQEVDSNGREIAALPPTHKKKNPETFLWPQYHDLVSKTMVSD